MPYTTYTSCECALSALVIIIPPDEIAIQLIPVCGQRKQVSSIAQEPMLSLLLMEATIDLVANTTTID